MSNAIQRADSNGTGSSLTPTLQDTLKLGEVFAKSGYFTDARDASQAVVKILAGAELGLPAMSAMSGIYIVQGRPTLSANLMAALVKRSGRYNYRVTEHSDKACTILYFECLGGNWEQIGESRFTIEDAKRAKTKNIEMFPRNMLFARAMSNGVRWYCPDVTSGPTYTPDELNEGMEAEPIQNAYTEAPAVTVESPTQVEIPAAPSRFTANDEPAPKTQECQEAIATKEQREEILSLLAAVFPTKADQGAYLVDKIGKRPFKDLRDGDYWLLSYELRERLNPSMKPQTLEIDTETGEIFEEDAFEGNGEQQKQDRQELLSAIADLEAAAEQQGEFSPNEYRKMIGVPPSLSLCSTDHLRTYRNQLSAYVSQDEGLLGEETPPVTQSTDIRAIR